MLGPLAWDTVESFGSALRAAWISFARCGTPDRDATAGWPVSWARGSTLEQCSAAGTATKVPAAVRSGEHAQLVTANGCRTSA